MREVGGENDVLSGKEGNRRIHEKKGGVGEEIKATNNNRKVSRKHETVVGIKEGG